MPNLYDSENTDLISKPEYLYQPPANLSELLDESDFKWDSDQEETQSEEDVEEHF